MSFSRIVRDGRLPPNYVGYSLVTPTRQLLDRFEKEVEQDEGLDSGAGGRGSDWDRDWPGAWRDALRESWRWDAHPAHDQYLDDLLVALEARLLDVGWPRRPNDEDKVRQRDRCRSAWKLLTRDRFHPRQPYDAFRRWHPVGAGAGNDLDGGAVLAAIAAASERRYGVLFPTVPDPEPGGRRYPGERAAHLLQAWVTRLTLPREPQLPQLLAAPWSVYRLSPWPREGEEKSDLQTLEESLFALDLPELRGRHFLIELSALEDKRHRLLRPPDHLVEGQSLGLAVLLAAWAAHHGRPTLPTVVATGAVGQGGIGRVEGVELKREAAEVYARKEKRRCRFLVPEANAEDAGESGNRLDVDTVGGLAELFSKPYLWTDGCEEYERAFREPPATWPLPVPQAEDDVGAFAVADLGQLTEAARFIARTPPQSAFWLALPFTNEPAAAVRHVLKHLVDHRHDANPDTQVAMLALPLPLTAADAELPARGRSTERVLSWVAQGMKEVCPPGAALSPEALRNMVGSLGDRLVLVLYGKNSLAITSDREEARLGNVWDGCRSLLPQPPRVLFLASHLGHGRLMARVTGAAECPLPAASR